MTDKEEKISLLIFFIFAITLRFTLISQKNLWFDEIYSWHITLGAFRDIVIDTAGDIHPPFYYFVLKIWEELFGTSVTILRSLSLLFSASAVFFLYPISKRMLNTNDSIIVLFLYCISPLNIYFGQEVRMASLNLFLNVGAVYFLILLLDKTENIKEFYLNISFYLYTLFTLLALYTHYFSFFILGAEVLFILYHFRKDLKKLLYFIPSFALIVLGYSPWFYTMFEQVKRGQSWRGGQTPWAVIYQFLTFIKDIGMGFYHRYINDYISYPIDAIIFVIIFLSAIGLIKIYRKEIYNHYGLLIIMLASIPFIAAVIISFKQWIEYFRYLSIIIPFIIIFIMTGIQYFKKKVRYAIIITFILINIVGLIIYYGNSSKNNDYRNIIRDISGEVEENELYVYPHYFGWIMEYYYTDQIPYPTYYGWEFPMLVDTVNVHKPKYFWLVMDNHSMDSSSYGEYIRPFINEYDIARETVYLIEPNTVKLYRFERKQ